MAQAAEGPNGGSGKRRGNLVRPEQPNNQVMLNLGAMAEGEAPSPERKRLMARAAISSLNARRLFVRTIRRTAVYETRTYGGVGGEGP